jgi:dTDP-4-amino-4,6-dideoxygalactose transaminase
VGAVKVPLVDLYAQYEAHAEEFDGAFREVIKKTAFIGGEFVLAFENAFAAAYGVKHCIPVANGTDAIYIVLKMLGIGSGDEIITTATSWISTSETISQTGATPVFVDVDEYYNIDVAKVRSRINGRTRAILPVHLYGQAAQVDALAEIAAKNDLFLIEDCAQAHFAERHGRNVGTFGIAGTFSFYPGKNLGAYGDAGAIITNNDELAQRCKMFANHGSLVKHRHVMEGINSRLDGLQAALLTQKLKYIGEWTAARQRVARWYDAELRDLSQVVVPAIRPGSTHVYHLYVIKCEARDDLKSWLGNLGIETAIHYPSALPFLPAYERFNLTEQDFPVASVNQRSILSLPIYPEIAKETINYVANGLRDFYRQK